ncbi:hypothetical protein OIV83_005508 [Microbotryomycetes sp. JL201]|nr:hypothetical protein OIV83_005508 [Microbotryomycetes sp. JL201]
MEDRYSIGVGRPSECENLRDITIKPSHRDARPISQVNIVDSSKSAPVADKILKRSSMPRYSLSTPSTHAPIPAPTYPILSQQSVSLSRSPSLTDASLEPTISGGLTRRLSISSSEDDAEHEECGQIMRAERYSRAEPNLTRRDSLPPSPLESIMRFDTMKDKLEQELAELPPNPKLWLPSHLATYLATHLSLHPVLREDVTSFVRASRLSGRTFLRLRDSDLESLGVNIAWRKALNEARARLRRESLCGRVMWGFEGGDTSNLDMGSDNGDTKSGKQKRQSHSRRGSMEVEGSDLSDEEGKEEWKRSWRMLQGNRRVRCMVGRFEDVVEASREGTPNVSPVKIQPMTTRNRFAARQFPLSPYPLKDQHQRESSGDSQASIDPGVDEDQADGAAAATERVSAPSRLATSHLPSTFSSPSVAGTPPPLYEVTDSSRQTSPASAPQSTSSSADASPASVSPLLNTKPLPNVPNYQGLILSHSHPYGLVRRPSHHRQKDGRAEKEGRVDDGDGATVRSAPYKKAGSHTGASVRFSDTDGRKSTLQDLFGIDVSAPGRDRDHSDVDRDEVLPFTVNGGRDSKGSMVLVKRSQLEELARRMNEVEMQVALVQGQMSASNSVFDCSEVEELDARLSQLETVLQNHSWHGTTSSTVSHASAITTMSSSASSSGSLSHTDILSRWFRNAFTTFSMHDIATASHDSARMLMDPQGPLMGWTSLGGYILAASIGIGIVAGEVVVARVFGIRRRA